MLKVDSDQPFETKREEVTGLARASFAAAQRAVRLSPQPGLRSEAG